jgi:hypothetical protein
MTPRRGFILGPVLAAVLSIPVAVWAGSPATAPSPLADGAGEACRLGVTGEPELVANIYPPDDVYYVLLRPSTCGPCSGVTLSAVRIWLEFQIPCSVPMGISVVKAVGDGCLRPDPGQVLYAAYDTTVRSIEEGIPEYVVPLPPDWKITEDAFIAIHFNAEVDSCDAEEEKPRLSLRPGCQSCTAYEGLFSTIEDVCQFGSAMPLISVDVAECVVTPTLTRTWGSLKTLYR